MLYALRTALPGPPNPDPIRGPDHTDGCSFARITLLPGQKSGSGSGGAQPDSIGRVEGLRCRHRGRWTGSEGPRTMDESNPERDVWTGSEGPRTMGQSTPERGQGSRCREARDRAAMDPGSRDDGRWTPGAGSGWYGGGTPGARTIERWTSQTRTPARWLSGSPSSLPGICPSPFARPRPVAEP